MKNNFKLKFTIFLGIIFLSSCSHIQKINSFNSKIDSSTEEVSAQLYARSFYCPLFGLPNSLETKNSKMFLNSNFSDMWATIKINPENSTYWWGPLWLPILPIFLFDDKKFNQKIDIELEYNKVWKSKWIDGDSTAQENWFKEINDTKFPMTSSKAFIKYQINGKTKTIESTPADLKSISTTKAFRVNTYSFTLLEPLPDNFEFQVDFNNSNNVFKVQRKSNWMFTVLHMPFYCGLN